MGKIKEGKKVIINSYHAKVFKPCFDNITRTLENKIATTFLSLKKDTNHETVYHFPILILYYILKFCGC